MEENTDLGTVTDAAAHFIDTGTETFTAEDIEYAREKFIAYGFDYEAAKAPHVQKKVSWLTGIITIGMYCFLLGDLNVLRLAPRWRSTSSGWTR